ncbi:YciI family protein [Saccharibacillus sacchari]|uniref:YciI family protein n=1 Tax=Saccharibacillus sacchari TaxID=456493 RepID=A0ACC6P5X7_9BACL
MLFMILVKAAKNSEEGKLPSERLMQAMDAYNEELEQAGVRVMAKGLHPTANAIRISYPADRGEPVVTNGPFAPAEDLVAGFILIDVATQEDAVRWAKRMPDPQGNGEGQIELRQVF